MKESRIQIGGPKTIMVMTQYKMGKQVTLNTGDISLKEMRRLYFWLGRQIIKREKHNPRGSK